MRSTAPLPPPPQVSGLAPQQVFAFDGKSAAGVDYYDAAAVRLGRYPIVTPVGRPLKIEPIQR